MTGNVTGAARTILSANILGASCARVCPTEVLCEGACVMFDRDSDPIKIGRLQRCATDHVYENRIPVLQPVSRKSAKRVAVIGGGPAGMGCAAELAQLGHAVVIFEKKTKAGSSRPAWTARLGRLSNPPRRRRGARLSTAPIG